ncbi:MAG TPA: hypothetical protein VHG28_06155 [Longimicrobiaceae bacterium]|nr:hypothetical protein [Longimicrobiaceae bacterium]
MRKPISKHALRRAMERVQGEGLLQWSEPTGAVVDRVWHEIEKEAFNGKKPTGQTVARKRRSAAIAGGGEPEAEPEAEV